MVNEAGEQNDFVDPENLMQLDDIPQIPMPFEDDISDDLKNLLRAVVINQQNMINNSSFLYDRIKEISIVLKKLIETYPVVSDELPDLQMADP